MRQPGRHGPRGGCAAARTARCGAHRGAGPGWPVSAGPLLARRTKAPPACAVRGLFMPRSEVHVGAQQHRAASRLVGEVGAIRLVVLHLVGDYEDGTGVAADPAEAFVWYQRSAEAGDFRGQYSLAAVLAGLGRVD